MKSTVVEILFCNWPDFCGRRVLKTTMFNNCFALLQYALWSRIDYPNYAMCLYIINTFALLYTHTCVAHTVWLPCCFPERCTNWSETSLPYYHAGDTFIALHAHAWEHVTRKYLGQFEDLQSTNDSHILQCKIFMSAKIFNCSMWH